MKLVKKLIGTLLLLGTVAVFVGQLHADTPVWPPPVPAPLPFPPDVYVPRP